MNESNKPTTSAIETLKAWMRGEPVFAQKQYTDLHQAKFYSTQMYERTLVGAILELATLIEKGNNNDK